MIYLLLKKKAKSDGWFHSEKTRRRQPQTNFFDPISKMKLATSYLYTRQTFARHRPKSLPWNQVKTFLEKSQSLHKNPP